MKTSAATALLLAAGSPAIAQTDGIAIWLWEVSNVVDETNPSATVSLFVEMFPPPDGNFEGFGAAIWDTLGGALAKTGTLTDWTMNSGFTFLLGDTTETDGVSLFGSQAGQIPGFCGPFDNGNPVWIMDFTWETTDFSPRSIEYATATEGNVIAVWVDGDPDGTPYEAIEAQVTIQVGEACLADCNDDSAINIFDFLCFQGLVSLGDPRADCNADGSINIFDFLCFQGLVTKGC